MATQSDLDKLRKQLSDLDAKLKSMRGNSPQRNPNFDSAMANQNYANLMRDQQARLAAERGGQAFPPEFGRPSPEPMINPETIKKARAEYIASQPKNRGYRDVMTNTKYGGQFGSSIGSGFDKWFETNYINNPNSSLTAQERASIIPQRRITADEAGRMQGSQRDPNTGMTFQEMMNSQLRQGPQFTQGRLMGAPTNRPIPPGGGLGGLTADQAGIPADQRKILDDLMARQVQQPIPPGGGMGGSIGAPENMRSPNMPQDIMAAYNNFLQQGMQNSNAINQGAMTDFANMEPGMQTTQPATATTPKPAMPIAGMGMQKSSTAPRKFSTVKASPPRFG